MGQRGAVRLGVLKDGLLVVGTIAGLCALAFGLVWVQTGPREAGATAGGKLRSVANGATAAAPGTAGLTPVPRSLAAAGIRPVTVPGTPATEPVLHTDIYFDVNRSRLRADAAALLQSQAAVVAGGGSWAVLVQGYADQVGAAEYNRALALRRADAVKQFLVELGVPAASIKVVTIGQEGALCDDPGAECRRLNRRVHVEMRRLPPAATTPAAAAPAPKLAAVTAEAMPAPGPAVSTTGSPAAAPAGTVRDEQLFEVR